VASGDALAVFEDGEFDFVCSIIVLQHLPLRRVLERAISELCRVLSPGGALLFQLPTHIPPWHRVQARPRLYRALRRVGAPPMLLLRAGLIPISVLSLPEATVRRCILEAGGRVERVETETEASGVRSATYVVSRDN
jgi:SAM-dependent methyltransferase